MPLFQTPTLDILFMAPSGCGKTTLLAGMYHQLREKGTGLLEATLKAEDPEREKELMDCSQKWVSAIQEQQAYCPFAARMEGTRQLKRFPFSLVQNGAPKVLLNFLDSRGGDVSDQPQEFLDLLQTCQVVLNIIDGAVLMQAPDLNEELNQPTRVANLLHNTLSKSEKHLVIMIITKCEKYLKTDKSREEMRKAFKKHHVAVINAIKEAAEANENVMGVYLPVMTLGCVEFAYLEKDSNGNPRFIFRKNNAPYQPKYLEDVFRLIIAFSHHARRGWLEKILGIGADPLADFRLPPHTEAFGNIELIQN